jgi:hypothetical protein
VNEEDSQLRIIAFINDAGTVWKILDHIAESTEPPRVAAIIAAPV